MAEPEQLVVICEKCGARLKLKPMQAKILPEVKCGKCGNRIPTSKAVPASQAPASVAVPLSEVRKESAPVAAAPVVVEEKSTTPPPSPARAPTPLPVSSSDSAPVAVPTMASYSKPAGAALSPAAPQPKERTQTIKSRTANFGPAPGVVSGSGSESPAMLKQKIAELEDEVNVFRKQVLGLQDQIAKKAEESGRFQELIQRAADAEDRAAELQEMWYQKEKDVKKLEERITALEHAREDALAERDVVLNDIKDILATYHSQEIEAARKRLADLDDRMDRFISLMRQRHIPAAPAPAGAIEAAENAAGG